MNFKKKLGLVLILFLLLGFIQVPEIRAVERIQSLDYCGETVPLNRPEVAENLDQNLVLISESQSRIWLTLRRMPRYEEILEKALKANNMPSDLKYIAIGVSGLNPSYAGGGGRGMWRIKNAQAASMGLTVNSNVDERLDPYKATDAALIKLKTLQEKYGSWTLATAAFLGSELDIDKAVSEAGGEKNYYKLYIEDESIDYSLNLVLVGKVIFTNLQSFGYSEERNKAWKVYNVKRVSLSESISVRALAEKYKLDYKSFRDLNPHLISTTAPKGTTISIPN